ncbi:MAG TPA: DUF6187 family protein [Actinophytocola sp.]|jgi:hypothetical protein|uniref:DUF6187 family protein n=1 Tax=Actinophytocola sp. TaxID=1872138 RepID=UPI002F92908C
MSDELDTVFSLPAVDADPDTEIGILLMGLGADRLLAGLGVACRGPAEHPATVTMVVDQLRHGVRQDLTFGDAVAAGARRWQVACQGFAAANLRPRPRSAALRRLWADAAHALAGGADVAPQLRTDGAAERVYLTACWLRPEEITQTAEAHVVLPELPS